MKSILLLLGFFLVSFCRHLQRSSSINCRVVVNGIDLSTKVNGKIVSYRGSKVDRENNLTRSRIVVLDSEGNKK